MKTSPSSSPTTSRRSTASRSMATWTTARRIPRSAGASPTRGCRWPATATRASRTACRSTNGASAWKAAVRSARRVERGGDTNGPAAVYSIVKYLDWMKKYAPPQAQGMTFSESGPVPAQGNIAQQMFWYTAFTADMVKPGIAGDERRRHAEMAHGAVAARLVLEGRHEARLSGRRLGHAAEVDAAGSPQGGLALSAVHHLEDGVA